jgi:ribose transport system permease protein
MTTAELRRRLRPARVLSTHGLLVLTIALVIVFSALLPATFPTTLNARSILANESITAFASLAVMVPLAAGQYDLSVGFVLGLASVLAVGLQVKSGIPWPLALIVGLLAGSGVGFLNGLLIAYVRIDSFIVTLGVGTAFLGIADWYTGGLQLAGTLPHGFVTLANWSLFSVIPGSAVYLAVVALVLWIVLEYLPVGRRLYALGFNYKAAELVGVRGRNYILGAMVVSGFLSGCAGVLLASQLQSAQSTTGPDYLLPAFVGALLGATSVRPGRVNVGGTILAVLVLAVGIAGLAQEGAQFFVTPLFNGGTLVAAVAVAAIASRRRLEHVARLAISPNPEVMQTEE